MTAHTGEIQHDKRITIRQNLFLPFVHEKKTIDVASPHRPTSQVRKWRLGYARLEQSSIKEKEITMTELHIDLQQTILMILNDMRGKHSVAPSAGSTSAKAGGHTGGKYKIQIYA